ncbi:MAG: hypothetical protein ACRC5H_09995, partial [Treponemataceae bacterium]
MKKIYLISAIINGVTLLCAFEWPQSITAMSDFSFFFGQPRSDTFSTGIGFASSDQVYASNTGEYLVSISESPSVGWFDSPLGNTVITINANDIITVYGNLEEVYLEKTVDLVEQRMAIGASGNSGWQKSSSSTKMGLEHQILDNRNKVVLNPLPLYPSLPLVGFPNMRGLVLINRSGTVFELAQTRSIPAGQYTLFFEHNIDSPPYKTSVTINGVEAESILYDQLREMNNQLYAVGKKFYDYETIYPEGKRQLLMNGSFIRGKAF